ncbi:hypothetical protein AT3G50550 [Arabidopsis thaliana]|uniref:Uncharacterized protein At3g50550 n=1 Tax=Arabidopsis thaliana TaxID=3702 RepID=Q0WU69_ARATH|nr:uncharacterized protein AT3G50550 [Arabidopsis thaliana]AEE78680.1 hypothetical protein AT3G50550 [Arabidopsis thaliana]BAE99329.1 hypothetical protein [Arabidopsis thaliana]|eukprot:NP_850675.1 hypothetical protein AT3G50550 [Arabidopsis thaliana]
MADEKEIVDIYSSDEEYDEDDDDDEEEEEEEDSLVDKVTRLLKGKQD